jgi:hypothetical protein
MGMLHGPHVRLMHLLRLLRRLIVRPLCLLHRLPLRLLLHLPLPVVEQLALLQLRLKRKGRLVAWLVGWLCG